MKLLIERAILFNALQRLISPINNRPILPILSHFLFEIANQSLTIISTDLEIEMKITLPLISNDSDGAITVPAKKLFDICRTLSNESQITIEFDESHFVIKQDLNRFSLVALPAVDYPSLENWQTITPFSISQHELKKLLESVQFAMANQDVRYFLNGILFEIANNQLTLVATDGHRLAMNKLDLQEEISQTSFILPRKSVVELIKLLNSQELTMQVELGAQHVRFHFDKLVFTSKLIDGKYPDYRRVLPPNPDKIFSCARTELKQGLMQVAILSNDKFKGVRLLLDSNQLKMTAHNQQKEEAEVNLSVKFNHPELEIRFNIGYLVDILNHISTEIVQFLITDSVASVQIQSPENEQLIYIIMPMRL